MARWNPIGSGNLRVFLERRPTSDRADLDSWPISNLSDLTSAALSNRLRQGLRVGLSGKA